MAFIEQQYARVRLTQNMQLDLFFTDASSAMNANIKNSEEQLLSDLQKQTDTNNFWLTISSQIVKS